MIVIASSFAVVIGLALAIFAVWPSEGVSSVTKRKNSVSDFRSKQLSSSSADRMVAPLLESFRANAAKVTPEGMVEDSKKKLAISGLSATMTLEKLLGIKLLTALIGGAATFVWAPIESPVTRVAAVFGGLVIGFILPDVYVSRKAEDRQNEIRATLPEVLDQLTVVVEAGMGFDSALKKVVSSSEGPLIEEFARSLRAMRLGLKRSEALAQIGDRTDVGEVRQFVSAIKQADTLGVPIAKVLRTQSVHMRELKRLKAEEAAMRLPVKLTFPMVFCMLPALFVLTLGPVVIRIMDSGVAG